MSTNILGQVRTMYLKIIWRGGKNIHLYALRRPKTAGWSLFLNQLLWACKYLRTEKIHLSSNWADPGVYKPFWVPLRCGTQNSELLPLHRRLQMFIGTHLNKTTPPPPSSVTKQRETFWLQFLLTGFWTLWDFKGQVLSYPYTLLHACGHWQYCNTGL